MIDEKTTVMHKQDADGNTPLHEATYYGCLETAMLLFQAGCDLNVYNNKGETPLFKAQFKNNRELIKLLSA